MIYLHTVMITHVNKGYTAKSICKVNNWIRSMFAGSTMADNRHQVELNCFYRSPIIIIIIIIIIIHYSTINRWTGQILSDQAASNFILSMPKHFAYIFFIFFQYFAQNHALYSDLITHIKWIQTCVIVKSSASPTICNIHIESIFFLSISISVMIVIHVCVGWTRPFPLQTICNALAGPPNVIMKSWTNYNETSPETLFLSQAQSWASSK